MWKFKRYWVGPGQLKVWENKFVAIAYYKNNSVKTDGVCLYNEGSCAADFECWVVDPYSREWKEYLTGLSEEEKRRLLTAWLCEQMLTVDAMELVIK